MNKQEKAEELRKVIDTIKELFKEDGVSFIGVSISMDSDYFDVRASKGEKKTIEYQQCYGKKSYIESEEL